MQFLQELVLDHNRVKMISDNSFAKPSSLVALHLEENRLRELNNLQPLGKLQKLFLGLNRIQDLSELEKLDCLPCLKELSVYGNPVSRKIYHRPLLVFRLPSLQVLDGVNVTSEERAKAEIQLLEQQVFPLANCQMECGFPGPQSFPKACTMRIASVNLPGSFGHMYGADFVFPHAVDDVVANEASKNKKIKNLGLGPCNPRSIHAELALRQAKASKPRDSTERTFTNDVSPSQQQGK